MAGGIVALPTPPANRPRTCHHGGGPYRTASGIRRKSSQGRKPRARGADDIPPPAPPSAERRHTPPRASPPNSGPPPETSYSPTPPGPWETPSRAAPRPQRHPPPSAPRKGGKGGSQSVSPTEKQAKWLADGYCHVTISPFVAPSLLSARARRRLRLCWPFFSPSDPSKTSSPTKDGPVTLTDSDATGSPLRCMSLQGRRKAPPKKPRDVFLTTSVLECTEHSERRCLTEVEEVTWLTLSKEEEHRKLRHERDAAAAQVEEMQRVMDELVRRASEPAQDAKPVEVEELMCRTPEESVVVPRRVSMAPTPYPPRSEMQLHRAMEVFAAFVGRSSVFHKWQSSAVHRLAIRTHLADWTPGSKDYESPTTEALPGGHSEALQDSRDPTLAVILLQKTGRGMLERVPLVQSLALRSQAEERRRRNGAASLQKTGRGMLERTSLYGDLVLRNQKQQQSVRLRQLGGCAVALGLPCLSYLISCRDSAKAAHTVEAAVRMRAAQVAGSGPTPTLTALFDSTGRSERNAALALTVAAGEDLAEAGRRAVDDVQGVEEEDRRETESFESARRFVLAVQFADAAGRRAVGDVQGVEEENRRETESFENACRFRLAVQFADALAALSARLSAPPTAAVVGACAVAVSSGVLSKASAPLAVELGEEEKASERPQEQAPPPPDKKVDGPGEAALEQAPLEEAPPAVEGGSTMPTEKAGAESVPAEPEQDPVEEAPPAVQGGSTTPTEKADPVEEVPQAVEGSPPPPAEAEGRREEEVAAPEQSAVEDAPPADELVAGEQAEEDRVPEPEHAAEHTPGDGPVGEGSSPPVAEEKADEPRGEKVAADSVLAAEQAPGENARDEGGPPEPEQETAVQETAGVQSAAGTADEVSAAAHAAAISSVARRLSYNAASCPAEAPDAACPTPVREDADDKKSAVRRESTLGTPEPSPRALFSPVRKDKIKDDAAVVIQSCFRGFRVRQEMNCNTGLREVRRAPKPDTGSIVGSISKDRRRRRGKRNANKIKRLALTGISRPGLVRAKDALLMLVRNRRDSPATEEQQISDVNNLLPVSSERGRRMWALSVITTAVHLAHVSDLSTPASVASASSFGSNRQSAFSGQRPAAPRRSLIGRSDSCRSLRSEASRTPRSPSGEVDFTSVPRRESTGSCTASAIRNDMWSSSVCNNKDSPSDGNQGQVSPGLSYSPSGVDRRRIPSETNTATTTTGTALTTAGTSRGASTIPTLPSPPMTGRH
eukprot:Hpha_TRINITY_DN15468_c0_g1::TRINITY_DN15468_c0_g1_i2::g.176841::m.176841